MPLEYLEDYLVVNKEKRERVIRRCRKEILNFPEFDAIAFRGLSGALVTIPLAHILKKDIIVVRKPKDDEPHHSWRMVEGLEPSGKRIIIVDDFVSTGRTIKAILEEIKKISSPGNPCKFVGILLYNQETYSEEFTVKDVDIETIAFKLK